MKKSIQTQINNINDALAWLKVNKPEQYEQRFLQLVGERCRLRKLAATELENPAIAAYGESQKGKSYVITNLLSDNGKPFTVKTPEREYDFVKEINPITNNVEATGVVTRFTTFGNEPGRYNAEYPVMIKLLGISEIATILCDGYHSDITDYSSYSDNELKDISTEIYDRYKERQPIANPVVVEDDILDMKYYLQRCTGGSTQSLIRSPYFERVALIARKVEASEWSDIFAPLWHRNATLTRLFQRLSDALRNLNYAKTVYLPISAVLNTNQTLMSVQRINELGQKEKDEEAAYTKVCIAEPGGGNRVIERYDKSELSALCAEAVFKVEERFLNSELSYDMTMITDPAVRAKLPEGTFKKDIIRHTDLLDFPGARARNQLKEENLDKTDAKSAMTNDANVYLRGKVAYLFNRYSDCGLINILLFCHDNAQRNDDTLYITIENWIKQYVGDSAQQRARTLRLTGGVSPFFLIATKFNIDMTMADADADDVANSRTAIDQRWSDRFNVVLYKEVIHGNDAEWFQNWISEGETFKNTYLLRDYKYSGDTGKGNNLYTGFRETGREQKPAMDAEYYERMRTSFIESQHTRKFFANPACSWDVAATQNNDGALYLFEQLAVRRHMEVTRRELTASTLKSIGKSLYDILKSYYHANDAAAQLLQDMNQACAIRRELIFACNRDSYFFGRMIRELQITEKELYNCIYDLVNSSEMNDSRNDSRNYEIIRKDIGRRLDRCTTDEMKWECVMMGYNLPDREAAEAFLADKGVDAGKLFAGNFKRKTNSAIIAESVYNAWTDSIKKPEAINRLCDNGSFDPIEMSALVDNIELTARKLRLEETLDRIIEEHVKVMNVSSVNLSLIADLMASKINDFIGDLGYGQRSEEERDAAARLIDDNPMKFDPLEYIVKEHPENYTSEELTEMFDQLIDRPDGVTQAFENNYFRWVEFMIVSFLLKGQIIDYDIEANDRMGRLIERIIK